MYGALLRRAKKLTGVGLAALLTTAALGAAPLTQTAQADTAPPIFTPSTVAASPLPTWQITGVVWDQVVVGNTVYATGNFIRARPPGVPRGGPTEITVGHLIAYDIRTGERIAAFDHTLNAQGMTLAVSPDQQTLYVGGDFTAVDGAARSKLAAFDLTTNALKAGFPGIVGRVRTIVPTATTVYVGGEFQVAGGVTRKRLAAFRLSDNTLTGWAPQADDGPVWSMTMAPDQQTLVVGGQFSRMNNALVYGMAAVNATSGAVGFWEASGKIRGYGSAAITGLHTVGNVIYGAVWSQSSSTGTLEGSFTLYANGTIRWVADCLGDTYDIVRVGQTVYTASHSHDCTMIGGFPDPQPTNRWSYALSFTEAPTQSNDGPNRYGNDFSGVAAPTLLHWYPEFSMGATTGQYQSAWTVEGSGGYVVYGGEFPKINGKAQEGLTRFAAGETNATPQWASYGSFQGSQAVQAVQSGSNVTVTFPSAWDKDNETLTYEVFRNRGTDQQTLVTSFTAATNFWTLPRRSVSGVLPANGTSTYSVRVTDAAGNEVFSTNSNTILTGNGGAGAVTNQAPIVTFTAPVFTRQVIVDPTGTRDPDGSIASYKWEFGDGSTSTEAQTFHVYSAPGTYTIKLTVTDNLGAKTTATKSVTASDAPPPPTPVVAADTFDRTVAAGWGTADTGGSWVPSGSAAPFAVSGGAGQIKLNAAGSGPSIALPEVSSANTEVRLDFATDKIANGGGQYLRVIVRGTISNGYLARVFISSTGKATLGLSRVVNGVETDLGTQAIAGTVSAGQQLSLRAGIIGRFDPILQAKVWTGATEPTTWFSRTDAAPAALQQPGAVALRGYLSGSATNAPVVQSIRNLTVTSTD